MAIGLWTILTLDLLSERSPDEEGVETCGRSGDSFRPLLGSERSPDEEGVETSPSPVIEGDISFSSERSPDEEGVETAFWWILLVQLVHF